MTEVTRRCILHLVRSCLPTGALEFVQGEGSSSNARPSSPTAGIASALGSGFSEASPGGRAGGARSGRPPANISSHGALPPLSLGFLPCHPLFLLPPLGLHPQVLLSLQPPLLILRGRAPKKPDSIAKPLSKLARSSVQDVHAVLELRSLDRAHNFLGLGRGRRAQCRTSPPGAGASALGEGAAAPSRLRGRRRRRGGGGR
mmetsp:Transcript_3511/g.10658  ORF Transcript_3511/g.10658 Transcript_3511/m.10658 type:complete len:201 (-) Transcript_3511:54-656(-)